LAPDNKRIVAWILYGAFVALGIEVHATANIIGLLALRLLLRDTS
jgi:hypothetical protein